MNPTALTRLLRIASPGLPVGGFSYSQGLEWAVEYAGVSDESAVAQWIGSLLKGSMARFELPMLAAFYRAWSANDAVLSAQLNVEYLASRETAELRAESVQMGAALLDVLRVDAGRDATVLDSISAIDEPVFANVFAFAGASWELDCEDVLTAYSWSWLENQVTAAMKLVPLGQRAGQRLLAQLGPQCGQAMQAGIRLPRDEWSNFAPLFAIASSCHETQYTRLFRS